MRKFFKSLADISLIQQITLIIVSFIVATFLFFSVYLRGNIDDFVTNQVMNILERTQNALAISIRANQSYSESVYNAEISHFVFRDDRLVGIVGTRVFDQDELDIIKQTALAGTLTENEGKAIFGEKYFYRISYVDKTTFILSIVPLSYGKTIENQLMSGVSNNTALVFSISFFILILWVGSIITPLKQMQLYIEKIKAGDDKASLSIERKDEIGELADALMEMNEEIKSQQAAKEEMVHNISHDLKTPIATIKSYAESIKDGIYPYDTLEKSVDVIIENADRLEKKVYSLLFLNRLDYMMEQERNTDKTTEMHMVIDSVLLSLKMIKPEIQIIRNLKPAVFKGDSESWRVVVSNLLDNALRYAKSNITINLDEGKLSISNDGECISNERMQKLFKPFEKGTKGKFGLGLSICYKVCNNYGYSIVAENLENGVIFRITAKDTKKKNLIKLPEKKKETDK